MSDLSWGAASMSGVPEGYATDEVDLRFTQAELDMLYFSCLHDIGHPQAEQWALSDDGFETLLGALSKIQEFFEAMSVSGEPDLVVPQ